MRPALLSDRRWNSKRANTAFSRGEIPESSRGIRPSRVSRVLVALFAPGLGRLRLLTFPRSSGHFYRGLTAIPHSLRKIWAWGSHLFLENWLTNVAAPTSSEEKKWDRHSCPSRVFP